MIVKDWVAEAAGEINAVDRNCHCSVMSEQIAEDIITKHCPFKPGVAYMLMEHAVQILTNSGVDVTCGACMEVAYTGVTTNAHTCKKNEPTLLQCIDCKNTESPAGAMARQFNHGRCLHCGGYFKVVRA